MDKNVGIFNGDRVSKQFIRERQKVVLKVSMVFELANYDDLVKIAHRRGASIDKFIHETCSDALYGKSYNEEE